MLGEARAMLVAQIAVGAALTRETRGQSTDHPCFGSKPAACGAGIAVQLHEAAAGERI
jgi:hypothetical protein